MADIDNFSEINQNFDTIKTLLNSIRAQGILNTSDVDKLLSGINLKLEKINTEEDIDMIKVFLSELKQNLDERHNVLVSKFGAIESLFSNLLKTSAEMPKSADIKELFDIVATNLSVFTREVISQKETLTDINLRLDALRTDDSQKKDIIKNITLLKPDLERLNNGFDSIVISLNDNFKTVVKAISAVDKTESFDKFSEVLNNIELSSNTLLSAVQMLDKKSEYLSENLQNVATKDDIHSQNRNIVDLKAQAQEIATSVAGLSGSYAKMDSLSEKIDAAVNIIAGLKSGLDEATDAQMHSLTEQIQNLEFKLKEVSTDAQFDELKKSIESILQGIAENYSSLDNNIALSAQDIGRIVASIDSLGIDANLSKLFSSVEKMETEVKSAIDEVSDRLINMQDANLHRVLQDISTLTESLTSKLNQSQSEVSVLCEKNFGSVYENIADLKSLISQLDESNISANNAIFSSITDRLCLFENCLKTSLDLQEKSVHESTSQLTEQIDNLKNISHVLDYKMDSSVVEVGNVKKEFDALKTAVDNVLALDFVTVVKDLKVDLYASKQEIVNNVEAGNNDLSEKLANDLFGKYELLISKLDVVTDEIQQSQTVALSDIKSVLEKISASIVDVISYVSEITPVTESTSEDKVTRIADILKENSLNYIDEVQNAVDVIRVKIENVLDKMSSENNDNFDVVKRSISEHSEGVKKEIKISYSKLLEIQDLYNELKETLNVNNISAAEKMDSVVASAESIKSEIDTKVALLKDSVINRVSELKQELSLESTNKYSEVKDSVDVLYTKISQDVGSMLENLKEQWKELKTDDSTNRAQTLAKILDNFVSIKEYIKTINDNNSVLISSKIEDVLTDFASVKAVLDKVDENIDGDMTRQLSIIESNFESLVSQITILFDKSDKSMSDKINEEFESISKKMDGVLTQRLEEYSVEVDKTFENLFKRTEEHSQYLQNSISDIKGAFKTVWEEQVEENARQFEEIAISMKNIIDENVKLTAVDYVALKNKLIEFANSIETNNQSLTKEFNGQIDTMTKYLATVFDDKFQILSAKSDDLLELKQSVNDNKNYCEAIYNSITANSSHINNSLIAINNNMTANVESLKGSIDKVSTNIVENVEIIKSSLNSVNNDMSAQIDAIKASLSDSLQDSTTFIQTSVDKMVELLDAEKQHIQLCKDLACELLTNEVKAVSKNIEKETDVIIGEIVEQFDLLKQSQSDDIVNLTSRIEEIINSQIYTNIEDLKSHIDVKTNNTDVVTKLDDLRLEMTSSVDEIINNLTKLLDAGVFTTAMSDFKVANELFINSAVDRLNSKIQSFVEENGKDFENKLALFDKKFIDTLSDKFEELKMLSNGYNNAFESIQKHFADVYSEFANIKSYLTDQIETLADTIKIAAESTNSEVRMLNKCFENLRSQISSKSFDEAFQSSINKQITSLENLIKEQLSYVEDINELCANSLPDVTELNTLVKHSILESINKFSEKIDKQDIERRLNQLKSEIITQLLNVFNQISFVAEQEEILDFIQDKHEELITILSHIVTTTADVSAVKTGLNTVDNKIEDLKEDIALINDKISTIISSDGDVDYVYSLQEIESDIAGLRLVLNEMNENNKSQELSDLLNSTNDIYNLVDSIKKDFPNKSDFEGIAEDIISISTRTNKLILASDESYKTLQDNLQDFKLVINDLDERTKNFAQESGMDRIDSKLNAINTMVVNGAKTNQVFNQVFEYLAEWVDKASVQINSISDKVETLDDIGQIKVMLADLKAEAEDNSESVELIEALGSVFEKQTKRIAALESKLDKIIVETTINNKNNKVDLSPIESTMNKFLVAMDDKMSEQQSKIDSLESKLESVKALLDDKDTAQLTKKVGGMDRQIAKLNKSIEKIASHVVEK